MPCQYKCSSFWLAVLCCVCVQIYLNLLWCQNFWISVWQRKKASLCDEAHVGKSPNRYVAVNNYTTTQSTKPAMIIWYQQNWMWVDLVASLRFKMISLPFDRNSKNFMLVNFVILLALIFVWCRTEYSCVSPKLLNHCVTE